MIAVSRSEAKNRRFQYAETALPILLHIMKTYRHIIRCANTCLCAPALCRNLAGLRTYYVEEKKIKTLVERVCGFFLASVLLCTTAPLMRRYILPKRILSTRVLITPL